MSFPINSSKLGTSQNEEAQLPSQLDDNQAEREVAEEVEAVAEEILENEIEVNQDDSSCMINCLGRCGVDLDFLTNAVFAATRFWRSSVAYFGG